MSTAETFWTSKSVSEMQELRKKWRYDKRFSYDIQRLIPHLRNTRTITDLCCGTGEHILLLEQIFNFDKIFVTDINDKFVFHTIFNYPSTNRKFSGHHYDLNLVTPSDSLETDTVMWLGGIIYIVDDIRLLKLFEDYSKQKLIIKASFAKEELHIDRYSEDLKEKYEAKYRTLEWTINQLKKRFPQVKSERIYPNNLDSKYGTRQYLIVASSS